MTTATLPEYTLSREDGGSGILSVLVHGHHDNATALATAAEAMIEWEGEAPTLGFDPPVHTYLRQVPGLDDDGYPWLRHYFTPKPGRGAQPVTRVDLTSNWPYRCRVCGGRATTGFEPEAFYLEVEDSVPAVQPDATKDDKVWLCARHNRVLEQHRAAIWSVCNDPCPDCGHALGAHERYELDGQPCGLRHQKTPCPCTHPSPHSAVLTMEDLATLAVAVTP
jgi:hypothetical protein